MKNSQKSVKILQIDVELQLILSFVFALLKILLFFREKDIQPSKLTFGFLGLGIMGLVSN